MARSQARVLNGKRKALAVRAGLTGVGEGIAYCHWCGEPGWMGWLPAEHYYSTGAIRSPARPERAVFQHEIDHVVPRCRGGTNDLSNLVLSCRDCNLARAIADRQVV